MVCDGIKPWFVMVFTFTNHGKTKFLMGPWWGPWLGMVENHPWRRSIGRGQSVPPAARPTRRTRTWRSGSQGHVFMVEQPPIGRGGSEPYRLSFWYPR